ncbi:phage head closure protein [Salipiger mucosus]|uniref:Phage head-tail adaptor, putative n=1 Tax=Salipiger mucosus DSM 16094 TaxID=1123237 RepID=S9S5B8_9RHOB|nr:phage head closure protein [Salipiger mucosus]EPX85385.1 phage head-tail adaptor, putative [Salipiger mucosus DSM 16094]
MKAGKMVHVIEIQQSATTVNDAGTPKKTWSKLATLRAELIEQSTEEFLHNAGDTSVMTLAFRTRYLAGITDEHRVSFDGQAFDIEKIVTIGRRRGLELRCKAVSP